ncbi:hypothetical protein [Sorangium cellulosum]|uniref:hypothetical protein n=1 Tax=Sorangium cellulosum TaxID=56 RepID=UPI00133174EA|nr:hypothetical protein [Sorangium cellulosum]
MAELDQVDGDGPELARRFYVGKKISCRGASRRALPGACRHGRAAAEGRRRARLELLVVYAPNPATWTADAREGLYRIQPSPHD